MIKWKKSDFNNVTRSFDIFVQLFNERYDSQEFGTIVNTVDQSNGKVYNILDRTDKQIKIVLVYATIDVFICAEEIITSHHRSLLDYCIFHLERNQTETYEKYIHLMACHCLVQSKYFTPGIDHPPVEFYSVEQELSIKRLEKVKRVCNFEYKD